MPLKIAAKVDRVDQAYWEEKIRPMVEAHTSVEYIGEITEYEKASFLGEASALLFPVDWPEPFGLVMIEAMACGTPVIALNRGSVSEVVEEGISGFVVDSFDQAIAAVGRVATLDRAKVRAAFEQRFTADRMARDYLEIYQAITSPRAMSMKRRKIGRVPNLPLIAHGQQPITTGILDSSERVIEQSGQMASDCDYASRPKAPSDAQLARAGPAALSSSVPDRRRSP
jgi:hypothetical protein